MKGYIRNIPLDKLFGFIKTKTQDNIFLHADNYRGDWDELAIANKSRRVFVEFELEESAKGPRATKCVMINEEQYNQEN